MWASSVRPGSSAQAGAGRRGDHNAVQVEFGNPFFLCFANREVMFDASSQEVNLFHVEFNSPFPARLLQPTADIPFPLFPSEEINATNCTAVGRRVLWPSQGITKDLRRSGIG